MLNKDGTLFYNWAKIAKHCNNSPSKVRSFFIDFYKQPDPKFDGYSFLLNPRSLLLTDYRLYSDYEVSEYIMLAGLRNYFDFQYLDDIGISLIYVPFSAQVLKNNRLLEIEGNKLYFKFEKV